MQSALKSRRQEQEEAFSIFHFPFLIWDSRIVDFLFVYVRVISWIVLISPPSEIHEVTRNEIRKMTNEKCQ